MTLAIDLGASLVKIGYKQGRKYRLFSEADYSIKQLAKHIKKQGFTKAHVIGIGDLPKEFKFLDIIRPQQDLITYEIETQVKGAKKLARLPKQFLLVSIGTGTSFTKVNNQLTKRIELGNPLGGGFILGMGKTLGFESFEEICKQAKKGNHENVDLYYKDLIVASFGQAKFKSKAKDLAAGLMNTVAITTWKDIINYSKNKHIIIIGSTLNNNPLLKKLLKHYLTASKRKVNFIKQGEFSNVVGVLESVDS